MDVILCELLLLIDVSRSDFTSDYLRSVMETSQSTILIEMPVADEPICNGFFHARSLGGISFQLVLRAIERIDTFGGRKRGQVHLLTRWVVLVD